MTAILTASNSRSAPTRPGWRDLRPRLASAAVLILVASLCIWQGGMLYGVMILAAMIGMAYECGQLFGLRARSVRGALYLLWPACAGIASLAGRGDTMAAFCFTAFVFGPPLWLGMAIIITAGISLLHLRLVAPMGAMEVLFVVAVVACSDSTAYVTGRLLGGPRLAPRISPGKTWSGSAGGLVGAMLAGSLVAWLSGTSASFPLSAAIWAALLGIAAQCGDLAESAVKRARGVKDSGTLLPGHGGLLDRFDALLAAAPLACLVSYAAPDGSPFWDAGWHDLADFTLRHLGMT